MNLPNDDPRSFPRINCRFSSCTQALLEIDRAEDFAYDEVRAFGAPSECNRVVSRGADRDRELALQVCGYTWETYQQELERRVSGKWIHFHGPQLRGEQ